MIWQTLSTFSNINKTQQKQYWRFLAIFLGMIVSLLTLTAIPLAANPATATIEFVSPSWVSQNINNPKVKVLDVRINPLEYIDGHLPKAVNIADNNFRGPDGFLPVQYWDAAKIAKIFAKSGINNDDKVIVYSDGTNVLGATMVAYLLERSGDKDIAIVDVGYKG